MTVCSICGKVMNDGQEVCPNGHRTLTDITDYAKDLQRTGAPITIKTENGLTSSGHIVLVTKDGIYLDNSIVIDDQILYSWNEIDVITLDR